ncbi:GMC family oxidoreductase [Mesorhizobium sp. M0761]|uniref:GMC family oxidoreductase n=1 Tax=Mesorhizobium sp. M0761 TaxID=2956994 RepID=UPI00333C8FBA
MASDYDIVIIGSGVAGALCAWKLSRSRRYKILIIEAGDNGITAGQRIQFHHTMDSQGSRGDMYAPYMDLESRIFAPAPEKSQLSLAEQRDQGKEKYYDYTLATKDPFKAGYNRMVGGSTWSWRGNCPRFIPSDFKLKTNFGVGCDWPLDYHELEPWYCQAEAELGVSGNHEEWDGLHGGYRSQPFPMRGIPFGYSDHLVKNRIEGRTVRGKTVQVVTTPQARNTVEYDERPACEGHSNCIPLCPIQAKYDATVHLRRVLQDPGSRVELKKAAVVTRLGKEEDGRVRQVFYKDWRSDDPQKERSVSAEVVVLAAHAIETPKILLMSGNLANRSDQVGRNLMDHIQFEVTALFPEPLYPFRGPQTISSIEAFRDGAFRSNRSAFRMTIGNDGWGRAGSPATVIDKLLSGGKFGSALPSEIASQIPKMLRLSFSTEMLPESKNQIDLSSKIDALGIPRPRFTFDVGDYVRSALNEGFDTAKDLFGIMGATIENEQEMPPGKWNTAAHIMGTCIMGDEPTNSVVDRWGRSHDVPNLWIVGSSVFSSSATANPTLTLAALSLRTAAAIERQMHSQTS